MLRTARGRMEIGHHDSVITGHPVREQVAGGILHERGSVRAALQLVRVTPPRERRGAAIGDRQRCGGERFVMAAAKPACHVARFAASLAITSWNDAASIDRSFQFDVQSLHTAI